MLTIKTWRDPYESGFSPTKPTSIQFEPGITVLVGCNGAGKTTLLRNIKEQMKKESIPYVFYDNLHSGGGNSISSAFYFGNMDLGIDLWTSSEGEAIKINFGQASTKFKRFLKDGFYDTVNNRLARSLNKDKEEKEVSDIRVMLFDAVDSGLSVDSIVEIKSVFELILKDAKQLGMETYIIISANEYELARNSNCFDVNKGRYIKFKDYEAYRAFIINSRKVKEKRIEKQKIWLENKRKREEEALAKRKEKYEPLINEIKETAHRENRDLTWKERDKIREYESMIENNRRY